MHFQLIHLHSFNWNVRVHILPQKISVIHTEALIIIITSTVRKQHVFFITGIISSAFNCRNNYRQNLISCLCI